MGKLGELSYVDADPVRKDEFFVAAAKLIAGSTLPEYWAWVDSSETARVAHYFHCAEHAGDTDGGGESYYLKLFLPRSRWEPLKDALRGSRCERAIREGRYLRRLGITTPEVIASGRVNGQDWMVTRGLEAIGLGVYFYAFLKRPQSASRLHWKRRVIVELGTFVGKLHRQGVVHGDLRLNNILIDIHAEEPTFILIDNERNSHYRSKIPLGLIKKNLVQVNMILSSTITRSDRLRFFLAYQKSFTVLPARASELVLAVQRKTVERLSKKNYSDEVDKAVYRLPVSNVPD